MADSEMYEEPLRTPPRKPPAPPPFIPQKTLRPSASDKEYRTKLSSSCHYDLELISGCLLIVRGVHSHARMDDPAAIVNKDIRKYHLLPNMLRAFYGISFRSAIRHGMTLAILAAVHYRPAVCCRFIWPSYPCHHLPQNLFFLPVRISFWCRIEVHHYMIIGLYDLTISILYLTRIYTQCRLCKHTHMRVIVSARLTRPHTEVGVPEAAMSGASGPTSEGANERSSSLMVPSSLCAIWVTTRRALRICHEQWN